METGDSAPAARLAAAAIAVMLLVAAGAMLTSVFGS